MDFVLSAWAWLQANIDIVFGGAIAAHGFAIFVVNLTPTPVDNTIVGKAYSVLEKLAGIFGYTAKEWPGERDGIASE